MKKVGLIFATLIIAVGIFISSTVFKNFKAVSRYDLPEPIGCNQKIMAYDLPEPIGPDGAPGYSLPEFVPARIA